FNSFAFKIFIFLITPDKDDFRVSCLPKWESLQRLSCSNRPISVVCTPFDRTGSLVTLSTEAKKFSWGEEFQARVRVNFIVILEPRRQQRDDGRGIRQDRQSSIVASEGFDESLGDSIGFRRVDRGEAKLQT